MRTEEGEMGRGRGLGGSRGEQRGRERVWRREGKRERGKGLLRRGRGGLGEEENRGRAHLLSSCQSSGSLRAYA